MLPSKRRESALESWCCRWARSHGMTVSKLLDPTCIMDHCFWTPGGAPWLVEFKDPEVDLVDERKGGITQGQWYYLIALRVNGYRTAIVTTKEGFLRLMNDE